MRLRDSAHHVLLLPQLLEPGIVLEVLTDHLSHSLLSQSARHGANAAYRSHDVTRAKHVHPDRSAIDDLTPLHGQAPAKLDYCGLGRVVHARGEAFVGDESAHGSNQ